MSAGRESGTPVSATDPPRSRGMTRDAGPALLAAALALTVVWAWLWWPNTIDDSYITYRYAEHLAHGLGAVYNPGERVEGYSSPLWMTALAAGVRLGLHTEPLSKAIGVVTVLISLVTIYVALQRARVGTLLAGAIVLLVASLPSLHLYTTSGLETVAMGGALVAATAGVGALEHTRLKRPVLTIALLASATLRPEGAVLAFVALAAWSIWGGESDPWPLAVLIAVALGALLMTRHAYYGTWVPTTFHVKPPPFVRLVRAHDPAAVAAMVRAWRANVWSGLDEIGGLVMVPLAALALRSRGWPAVAAVTGLAGFALAALMPADWMPGARFALPSMILLVSAAGWSANAIVTGLAIGRRSVAFGIGALIALWLARSTVVDLETWRALELEAERPPLAAQGAYRTIGRWLAAHAYPEQTLLAYEIGAVGYYSGLRVVDHEGLVTPAVAGIIRHAGESGPVRTGRDSLAMEAVVSYCVSANPDWFMVRTRAAPDSAGLEPALVADAIQRTLVERLGRRMEVAAVFPLAPPPATGRYVLLRRSPAATSP
jgi:arabinofuranosyltransferase